MRPRIATTELRKFLLQSFTDYSKHYCILKIKQEPIIIYQFKVYNVLIRAYSLHDAQYHTKMFYNAIIIPYDIAKWRVYASIFLLNGQRNGRTPARTSSTYAENC